MSDLVLPAPFRPLLRLLIASATVPAEEGEQSLGLPVTQRLAKEVVPGTSPKRLARAVSQVRGFLTSTGERAVVESRSLGGKRGAADGGGRQQTDEAFVRTVEYDGQTAYRFVLHAEDTIDWVQCLRELASASQILAAGGTTESKEIAKRWRRVLEQTDLDLAFDVPNNNIWQNSDRDAVWAARLRTYRILSIAGSPSPDSLVLAQKVLHQDRSSKFYDGPLAEAAIRSLFVVERSRDQVIAGFRDFVDKPDVRETLDLIALKADLSSQERWDEAQPVWAEKWGIAELDTTLVGAVQPETPPPRPGPSTRRSGPLLTPDPLTPGFSIDAMRRLGVPIDSEVAAELDAIARGAVDAVEHGDFVLQEQIGTRLAGLSGEFPDFGAAGRYFIAEGRRLQADMAKGTERIALRQAALEMYQESRELNPDSIRTIRGLARTLEVLGEPEEAAGLFRTAYANSLTILAPRDRGDPSLRWELDHEVLRVSRHYAHCLADLQKVDARAFSQFADETELHRIALASSALHRQRLPKFRQHLRWSQIEAFMGLTLLAKTYIAVGDDLRAGFELSAAFVERIEMVDLADDLTKIDVANLRWWCGVAEGVRQEPVPGWRDAIDSLAAALANGAGSTSSGGRRTSIWAVGTVCHQMLPPRLG